MVPRWSAEGDLGFAGSAQRLVDLRNMVLEWAESEGVVDDLTWRLVEDGADLSEQAVMPVSIGALEGVKLVAVGFSRLS